MFVSSHGWLRSGRGFWFVLGNGTSECYYFHENCFLMGTIAKACLQGSDLPVQQHFRWVQLRWDGEPMQGLLQRFLRRKVVNKVTNCSRSLCQEKGASVSGGRAGVLLLSDRMALGKEYS